MTDMQIEKRRLRKALLTARRALSEADRSAHSERIWAIAEETDAYKQAKRIMVFAALPDEVESLPFLQRAIDAGKEVYIPRITGHGVMEAARLYGVEELTPAAFDILEPPKANPVVDPQEIDLVLVPGVGSAERGARLGMGGGYYDRFLPRAVHAGRIAVVFSCQIAAMIPNDDADQGVDAVITERGIIKCR